MDGWVRIEVWLEGNHLGSPEEPMSIQPFWASLDGGTKRDESERARILQAARPSNEPDRARRSSTD